jgi:hypothetical protein
LITVEVKRISFVNQVLEILGGKPTGTMMQDVLFITLVKSHLLV